MTVDRGGGSMQLRIGGQMEQPCEREAAARKIFIINIHEEGVFHTFIVVTHHTENETFEKLNTMLY